MVVVSLFVGFLWVCYWRFAWFCSFNGLLFITRCCLCWVGLWGCFWLVVCLWVVCCYCFKFCLGWFSCDWGVCFCLVCFVWYLFVVCGLVVLIMLLAVVWLFGLGWVGFVVLGGLVV